MSKKLKIQNNIVFLLLILLIINFFENFLKNNIIFKKEYLIKNERNFFKSNKTNIDNNFKFIYDNNEKKDYNKINYLNDNEQNENGDDLFFIRNYNGGPLESKWEWVKNISIVYTWVDGLDINFQDLKAKYNGGNRNNNSRFRSADELLYSLRSVEKYMPWHHGNIYILTCQQIPKWLNINNPRLKMIYHKDIFPSYAYPTFDSGTIELFLDKIPGITERFIYFNDDFFLNNYVHPSYFFTSKGFYPKIYKNNYLMNLSENEVKKYILKEKGMFKVMSYNTKELIKLYFDSEYKYYHLHHFGYVFYRDLMEPFRQLFKEELKLFYFDKFRNWNKPHTLYLYLTFMEYIKQNNDYLEFKGNGKSKYFKNFKLPGNRTIDKYYVKVIPNSIGKEFIKYSKISDYSDKNEERFNFINSHTNILIYNFNDEYKKDTSLYELTNFMIEKYHYKSSFEKIEYYDLESSYYRKIKSIESLKKNLYKSLSNNYNNKKQIIFNEKFNIFNNLIKEYKLNIIKEYLKKKNKLSGKKKDVSDREIEEINFLLKYNGELLDENWKWARKISIVYKLDYPSKNLNITKFVPEDLKFSLRSIEKYIPWFEGNIFIIGYKEILNNLSWLNLNNKINLIYTENIVPDIIPYSIKNNFIEMYFDKIPGITEKFIYLKCNHFFINFIHPRFFFSNEFYPKYNFSNLLSKMKVKKLRKKNKNIILTYDIIMKYLGNTYANHYRYLKDAPIVMYRDLLKPVRHLYKYFIYNKLMKNLLPIYMIVTYNIFATNQIFYPNYVSGYGLIRNTSLPILNKNRTIKYYGYDITSPNISENTMDTEIKLVNNYYNDLSYIINIKNSKKLFISINKKLIQKDILYINSIMYSIYNKKSKYEY